MREIKFRVWDKLAKSFMEIFTNHKTGHALLYRLPEEIAERFYNRKRNGIDFPYATLSNVFSCPDFFEAQQFTGLKDKNGREIYEGDIIQHHIVDMATEGIKLLVRYDESKARYIFTDIYENERNFYSECYKVIGNIFENPTLWSKIDS